MEPDPYLEALRRVDAGRTATFAELARLAGRPKAARAAGRAVAGVPPDDPRAWHRIVHGDGSLAADPERAAVQLERLRAEGARPREGEEIRAWARRRRARFVGHWRDRAVFEPGDERVPRLDPRRVEALRDEEQTVARGFAFALLPHPRDARPSPTSRRPAPLPATSIPPTSRARKPRPPKESRPPPTRPGPGTPGRRARGGQGGRKPPRAGAADTGVGQRAAR